MPTLWLLVSTLTAGAEKTWQRAVQTARLASGVPDYDTYVRHVREHHPDRPVMSYPEFFNERQQARNGKGSARCC